MVELEFERMVEASPDQVFGRLADLSGYENWLPDDSGSAGCVVTSAGTVGLGTTYVDRMRGGDMVGEITKYDPPALLQFRQRLTKLGIPVFEATQTNELEAGDGGTLIRHRFHGRLFGPFRLAQSQFAKEASTERNRVLDALRESFIGPS